MPFHPVGRPFHRFHVPPRRLSTPHPSSGTWTFRFCAGAGPLGPRPCGRHGGRAVGGASSGPRVAPRGPTAAHQLASPRRGFTGWVKYVIIVIPRSTACAPQTRLNLACSRALAPLPYGMVNSLAREPGRPIYANARGSRGSHSPGASGREPHAPTAPWRSAPATYGLPAGSLLASQASTPARASVRVELLPVKRDEVRAQERGYAEPDLSAGVEGWDEQGRPRPEKLRELGLDRLL